jgi:hypothetical protein
LVTISPARSTKAIWISVARPPSLTLFPSHQQHLVRNMARTQAHLRAVIHPGIVS